MSVIITITAIALPIEVALISAGVFVRTHFPSEFELYLNIAVIPICAALSVFAFAQIQKQIKETEMRDDESDD